MQRQDLKYSYPAELIATERVSDSRIAYFDGTLPQEISREDLLQLFQPGDVLVINDTRVEKRRVFAGELEILFVNQTSDLEWDVLFPARDYEVGDQIALPGDVKLTLLEKGLPQKARLSEALGERYFLAFGEPALPPYIQKARGERHARASDESQYQSAWAEVTGSSAAPTASLHFSKSDLEQFTNAGVQVCPLTLHVGVGTFLPIKTENLDDHKMHAEIAFLPAATLNSIRQAKAQGKHVWALGTTVTRALESWAQGRLKENLEGDASGATDLFIQPGFQFQIVDRLMTNFHQPESSLLALVSAFAGLENVRATYTWAMEKRFRFFSYGDLTVWRGK